MTHLADGAAGSTGGTTAEHRRPAIRPLTGARFVAAIGVVAFHVDYHFGTADGLTAARRLTGTPGLLSTVLDSASGLGSLGVNFFFVLSGFILAYNYLGPSGLATTPKSFYLARLARVYPVYLVALLLAFAYRSVGTPCASPVCTAGDNAGVAVASVVLLQAWLPFVGDAFNGPGWTLSVETFFYACFPLLVAVVARVRRLRTLVLLGIMLLAATQVGPLIYGVVASALGVVPVGVATFLQFSPVLRLPEFVLGIVVCCWVVRRGSPGWLKGWRTDAVLVAGIPVLMVLDRLFIRTGVPPIAVNNGLFDVVFVGLILALATRTGRVNQLLSGATAQTLGESSYALYVLHWPVWYWLSRSVPAEVGSSAPFLLGYVVVVVAVAVLTWYTVERPARRLIMDRLAPRMRR